MATDPFVNLEADIARLAGQRDVIAQKNRDELAAKDRQQDESKAAWAKAKAALPGLVNSIDAMLKANGYAGVGMGKYDMKHADIDRALIEFAHNERNHTKIVLSVTWAGDFNCLVKGTRDESAIAELPIAALSEDRLKEILASAVMECLGVDQLARSEMV